MITHVAVNVSTLGDTTLVAAQAGKVIRVREWLLVAGGATAASFVGGTTPLTGPMTFVAGGGAQQIDRDLGHFSTRAGEALILRQTAAVQIGGHLIVDII